MVHRSKNLAKSQSAAKNPLLSIVNHTTQITSNFNIDQLNILQNGGRPSLKTQKSQAHIFFKDINNKQDLDAGIFEFKQHLL